MSVDFARRYMTEMRAYGVTVIEHPGWDRRGNGQTSAYLGAIIHHTGSGFDAGLDILINGRSDLSGPLCNVAGHVNGAMRLIAAHPANHAGAGAGRSMGPLPRTNLFNKLVWGLEIMYPGAQPMTREQMRSALIHAGVVSKILGRPTPEWVRAHAETSSTGKWDPGFAPGRTIDMARFRRDVTPTLLSARQEDDMTPEQDAMLRAVHHELTARLGSRVAGSKVTDTMLGYSINADANSWNTLQMLKQLAGDEPKSAAKREDLGYARDQIRTDAAGLDATLARITSTLATVAGDVAALKAYVEGTADQS